MAPLRAPQRVHHAPCGQRAGGCGRPGFGISQREAQPCCPPPGLLFFLGTKAAQMATFNTTASCLNIGRDNPRIPAALAALSSMALSTPGVVLYFWVHPLCCAWEPRQSAGKGILWPGEAEGHGCGSLGGWLGWHHGGRAGEPRRHSKAAFAAALLQRPNPAWPWPWLPPAPKKWQPFCCCWALPCTHSQE